MNTLRKDPDEPLRAAWAEVGSEQAEQRIDNFLMRVLKGVPKSHVYRLLRTGQVRVNSRRVDATYRLHAGDRVRLPPVRTARPARNSVRPTQPQPLRLVGRTLFEDEALLIIDKPAGMAAHGGSGIGRGVIEQLRAERAELRFLELVHRLDRETSGVLLLAKRRKALTDLHAQIRAGRMGKWYQVLVHGRWPYEEHHVELKLLKYLTASGERRVSVDRAGQDAHTILRRLRSFADFSLLEAEILTGRTHQIRVHLAHLGYPVAGDDKYGDFTLNRQLQRDGLKRMFLHAARVRFGHPLSGQVQIVEAGLPEELNAFVGRLEAAKAA